MEELKPCPFCGGIMPSEYTDRYRVGGIGFEAEDMRVDLVRRCRALAERERSE